MNTCLRFWLACTAVTLLTGSASAADLSGTWSDDWDNGTIEITQTGNSVLVVMAKEKRAHSWKSAKGTVNGNSTTLTFFTDREATKKDSTPPFTGTLESGGRVLRFVTGTWTRISAATRRSVASSRQVSVTWKNVDDDRKPIDLYWLDGNGKESQPYRLQPGQVFNGTTFETHFFVFKKDGREIQSVRITDKPTQVYEVGEVEKPVMKFKEQYTAPVTIDPQDFNRVNGIDGLGRLRLDQVTFPGTHNSGSGYRGTMYKRNVTPSVDVGIGDIPSVNLGGTPAIAGWFQNQDKSFTQQLDLGVRFFDIDTIWCDAKDGDSSFWRPAGAWTGHSGLGITAYAGPISHVVGQVVDWMNLKRNRHEVVVMHFGDTSGGRDIANQLARIFYEKAGPGHRYARNKADRFPVPGLEPPEAFSEDPVRLGTKLPARAGSGQAGNNDNNAKPMWPTLREAVEKNQRLFVFIEGLRLYYEISERELQIEVGNFVNAKVVDTGKPWTIGQWAKKNLLPDNYSHDITQLDERFTEIKGAYSSNFVVDAAGTSGLIRHVLVEQNARRMCDDDAEFVRMTCVVAPNGFDSLRTLAGSCSDHIYEACDVAYQQRKKHDRTVNFILVDYVGDGGTGSGRNNLFSVARELNRRNIERFAP